MFNKFKYLKKSVNKTTFEKMQKYFPDMLKIWNKECKEYLLINSKNTKKHEENLSKFQMAVFGSDETIEILLEDLLKLNKTTIYSVDLRNSKTGNSEKTILCTTDSDEAWNLVKKWNEEHGIYNDIVDIFGDEDIFLDDYVGVGKCPQFADCYIYDSKEEYIRNGGII